MIITRNPESDNAFYSVQFRDMELKILGIANAEKVLDAVKDYVEIDYGMDLICQIRSPDDI